MGHPFVPSGYCARAKKTLVLAAIVALLDAAPAPGFARSSEGPDLAAMLPEFNRICVELTRAREELRLGTLGEEEFCDRVLALFVDADSLNHSLGSVGASARRVASPLFAMSHGLRYLIDSLRENYVGIVARNGVSFVAADRALQAAVAWRSGVGATGCAEAVADASRP
jgi:hypothetical protein